MNNTNVIKFSPLVRCDNYYKSTCDIIKIESQEHLDSITENVINSISENSFEWFKKVMPVKQITDMFVKEPFENEMYVDGILIFKKECKLSFFIEQNLTEHNFFDEHSIQPDEQASEVTPVVEEVIENKIEEPVQEPVSNTQDSETETDKKYKRKLTIDKLKERLKVAINENDLDTAYKISKIIKQI